MAVKRPLFLVCIFVSLVAIFHYLWSRMDEGWENFARDPFCPPVLEGRVCARETRGGQEIFYVRVELSQDISAHEIYSILNSGDAREDRDQEPYIQTAAVSQAVLSYLKKQNTDQIQCIPPAEGFFAMPKIGSRVILTGNFESFPKGNNPGAFSQLAYYRGLGIGGRLTGVRILWQGERYDYFGEALQWIRAYFSARLEQQMPKKEAGILQTMLLGEKSSLDRQLKELYQTGGIIHILSISGLHITLLGLGIFRLLRRIGVPQIAAAVLSGGTILSYGIMTGMSISACRAIGMFLVRMVAVLWGRTYDMPTALGIMATGILCLQPGRIENAGFWLSFGSIVGVMGVLPLLKEILLPSEGKVKPGERRMGRIWRKIKEAVLESLLAGLAIQLTTLPLQLWFYYEVPLFSMALNLVVLPCMAPVLLIGFCMMLLPGAGFLSMVEVILLRIFEEMCLVVDGFSVSAWNPGKPALWQVIAYYVILGGMLCIMVLVKREGAEREKPCRKKGGGCLAWQAGKRRVNGIRSECFGKAGRVGVRFLILLPVLILSFPGRAYLGVAFLDVGQGDCVVIHGGKSGVWIYDCGSTSRQSVGKQVLIPYLKYYGIHEIQGIFLSHEDRDHANGLLDLAKSAGEEHIKIRGIYLGPNTESGDYGSQISQILGLTPVVLHEGDEISGRQVQMRILGPPSLCDWKDNESSLCLFLTLHREKGDMTVLLTGDMEGRGEDSVIEQIKQLGEEWTQESGVPEASAGEKQRTSAKGRTGKVRIDILKCAHHGSKNATSDALLDCFEGTVAVISCGYQNLYGHPHEETLERLKKHGIGIYRTDELGAVEIKWKRNGVLVRKK